MNRRTFAALVIVSWAATFVTGAFDATESTAQNLAAAWLTWMWVAAWCSLALLRRFWAASSGEFLYSGWLLVRRALLFCLASLLLSQLLYYGLLITHSSAEKLGTLAPIYAASGVLLLAACFVAPLIVVITWVTPLRKSLGGK